MFFMFRVSVLVGIRVRAVSQDVCPTVFRDDVFRVAVQGAEHPPWLPSHLKGCENNTNVKWLTVLTWYKQEGEAEEHKERSHKAERYVMVKNTVFIFKWKHKCNCRLFSMASQSQTVVADNNVSWKIIMTLDKQGKIIMQQRAHDLRFGSKSWDFHFIPTNLWKQIWGLSGASHCGWELIRAHWY